MKLSTALRNARATAIMNLLDAAATPGKLHVYGGGQPDPDKSITGMANHNVSTAYVVGDYVIGITNYYRAETAGTTASTTPTWPTDGGTVTDGGVTWQDMGPTPIKLGTLVLAQPSAVVADGELTFNTIAEEESAIASGTAKWARFTDGDNNNVLDGSLGTSEADFIINTTNVISGGPIRVTVPAKFIEPGA